MSESTSLPSPPLNVEALPPPLLMEGLGSSRMAITTRSPAAQAFFDQGLNLLHGFWYFEAWRAFKHASRLDSSCAMAYWGLYHSFRANNRNPREKKAALNRAKSLAKGASDREQYYIRAVSHLDSLGREGHQSFIREMLEIGRLYPDDIESKLFLVRFVMHYLGFYSGPRDGYPNREAILQQLLQTHPDHSAVHHYWIHAVEFTDRPERALESAARLENLAPSVGHIVHMPGHIYYRVGDYERARVSFLAAAAADSAYMVEQGIPVTRTWNYVHNLNYLLANYGEDGRYREGLAWARQLQTIPLDPKRSLYFYQGRMAPVRLQLRYGRWADAARTLEEIVANDTLQDSFAERYAAGLLTYAKGMAAVAAGDTDGARGHSAALDELEWELTSQSGPPSKRFFSRKRARALGLAALDLRGNLRSLEGNHEEAIELLQRGAEREANLGYSEPPRYARPLLESLAEAYLRAGETSGARSALERSLKKRPQNGHALVGIARTYAAGGDTTEATAAYREFLEIWQAADADLEQIREARAWIDALVPR